MNVGSFGGYGGGALVSSPFTLNGGTLNTFAMDVMSPGNFDMNGGTLSCGTLTITNQRQMHVASGGGKVPRVTAISIGTLSGGGFDGGIDLTDNAMIVDYSGASPLVSISNMIRNGTYDGINDSASGIISSTAIIAGNTSHPVALGYGEASTLGISTFEGESVDTTSILIRYTFEGDANLDGVVNALDFNVLATNYGGAGKIWTQGDANADGIVNSKDFDILANNYGQTVNAGAMTAPAQTAPALGTIVPEPTVCALLGAGALGLLRRSRSRHAN
jgi:hypothetical protein